VRPSRPLSSVMHIPGAPKELTRTVRQGEWTQPRTVIAFCGVVGGLITFGGVVVVFALANEKSLRYLVPWVLLVVFLFDALLLLAVLRKADKNPMALLLGDVTGRDWNENIRLTQGDSSTGETLDVIESTSVKTDDTGARPLDDAGDGSHDE
jgi:hypothetical protein